MDNMYYNYLAEDYDLKRKKPWNALVDFLKIIKIENLNVSGYCLDLGCGNGRNFSLFSNFTKHIIGLDNSIELLKLAKKKIEMESIKLKEGVSDIQLVLSSLNSLPIRPCTSNSAFIIAVIHHIKGADKRKAIMKQIYEIVKENGWVIVSVWRKFQKKYKTFFLKDFVKRRFNCKYFNIQKKKGLSEFGDKLIPWTISKKGQTYQRFYHFFSYREAKKLMNDFLICNIKKLGGSSKKDNYFFLARKMN